MKFLRVSDLKTLLITTLKKAISGGMRRRVSLARAFINNPKVLLLDEPFVSLDQPTAENLYQVLLDYWNKTNNNYFDHSRPEGGNVTR